MTTGIVSGRVPRIAAGALLAGSLLAIGLLPAWRPEQLSAGLFRIRQTGADTFRGPQAFFASHLHGKLHFYDDDPVASIAVKLVGDSRGPASSRSSRMARTTAPFPATR